MTSRYMPNYSTDESDYWQSQNAEYRKRKRDAEQSGDPISGLGNEMLSNYSKEFRNDAYANNRKKKMDFFSGF